MINNGNMIGQGAGDDKREFTWSFFHEVVTYLPGSPLVKKSLFSSGDSRTDEYRNLLLHEVAQQKTIQILGVRISHNLQFTPAATEPVVSIQRRFEEHSFLEMEVQNKNYDGISLSMLLPYTIYWKGDGYDFQRKEDDLYFFPEPILLPKGGNLKFELDPASGLTAAALTDTSPLLPDLHLANDRAFDVNFEFFGYQWRDVV